MSAHKQILGKKGEEIAVRYFQKRGFEIVARNYRCRYGEIDIMYAKDHNLFIVEVKTRQSLIFGYPEEAVTPAKKQRMLRCAQAFLDEQARTYTGIVLQVVAIYIGSHQVFARLYTESY